MFKIAKREAGDGLEACKGCVMLSTKPGTNPEMDETSFLFEEIESIAKYDNAFPHKTDWSCYPFEYQELFTSWRDAERRIKDTREVYLQKMFEAMLKIQG